MNSLATQNYNINLTVLLDADPVIAVNRSSHKERLPLEIIGNSTYYNRVRNGYLEIAGAEPNRVVVVNTAQTIEQAHAEIWSHVRQRLNL